ncbi:MAG: type III pantothenate kinase, partial [Bacteroidota bacterium]
MNLVLDIGNTRTKLGIFQGDKLTHREVWSELSIEALEGLAYNQKIENAIYSSTANVPPDAAAFLKKNFACLELTHETPLPIRLAYRSPQTLGKDRIAGAVGAFHHFPGKNCLIIDAGTCITFDVLDAQGTFLGGNIAPGVDMRLRAMHEFTARLPLVSPNSSLAKDVIAKLEF